MVASFSTWQTHVKYFNRILLKMWDEMAVLSFKHLKPNDFIYVSGHLCSYTKDDVNGNLRLQHEVACLTSLQLLPILLKMFTSCFIHLIPDTCL